MISATISEVTLKLDREETKELREEMREERHFMYHKRNWLRHNAMVPKGYLRFHVLEALNEQPMSGSELMDQIQKHTGGAWKPSPGSIYPLLAWLQDSGYIKEMPTENGLKRYEITQSGKELFAEETKNREKFHEGGGFWANPFLERMFTDIPQKKTKEIRDSMKNLVVSSMRLAKTLGENYSEKDLDEALQVLNDAAKKMDEINSRLRGANKNEPK